MPSQNITSPNYAESKTVNKVNVNSKVKSQFAGTLKYLKESGLDLQKYSETNIGISKATSNIEYINFHTYRIKTNYFSPYPHIYHLYPEIYICKQCLCYCVDEKSLTNHILNCTLYFPPGLEIYRQNGISIFAIDGSEQPIFCKNLCLLAKLFLFTKVQYANVDYFDFYLMIKDIEKECILVGFFSKVISLILLLSKF